MREDLAKDGVRNMEAVELGLRAAIMKDARKVLETLYAHAPLSMPDQEGRQGEKRHVRRPKTVETLFGPITLHRDYFYQEASGKGRAPLDEALGLINGYSPALVRLCDRAAARMGYGVGFRRDLPAHPAMGRGDGAGLEVSEGGRGAGVPR